MSGVSPTQRTLAAQRDLGRKCGIVERFVGPLCIRADLFGFIDIIALDPAQGIVAIQSCGQDWSGHVIKLLVEREQAVKDWLAHAPVELWAWRKVKLKRGGKAMRWKPRIGDVLLKENGELVVEERRTKSSRTAPDAERQ